MAVENVASSRVERLKGLGVFISKTLHEVDLPRYCGNPQGIGKSARVGKTKRVASAGRPLADLASQAPGPSAHPGLAPGRLPAAHRRWTLAPAHAWRRPPAPRPTWPPRRIGRAPVSGAHPPWRRERQGQDEAPVGRGCGQGEPRASHPPRRPGLPLHSTPWTPSPTPPLNQAKIKGVGAAAQRTSGKFVLLAAQPLQPPADGLRIQHHLQQTHALTTLRARQHIQTEGLR